MLMWTRHSLLAETPPRRGGSVLWAGPSPCSNAPPGTRRYSSAPSGNARSACGRALIQRHKLKLKAKFESGASYFSFKR